MRRPALGAVALLAAASLVSPTQASAVDQVDTSKLRQAVTVNGILGHERALQRIANQNGGTRASGTPGFNASVDYVTKVLKTAGYSVSKQTFTFSYFEELAPATLSVTGSDVAYETATLNYSGSGEVTGPVIPVKDLVIPATSEPSSTAGCEAADFTAPPAANSIALIQRGTCPFGAKVDNAKAAGYAAVILFNEGQPGRDELFAGTLGSPKTIPVVGLSFADGAQLYAQTQQGAVEATVATSTTNETRPTYNVIADSPAGKIADQVVVVGAHLDSVQQGPGINDNGSGTATILEIAKQMSKLKYKNNLQRKVRFAFWGAEESGLLGSQHYMNTLSDYRRSALYANLNFDMVGSPNYVRFVYDGDDSTNGGTAPGPLGSGQIEQIFLDYFKAQGLATAPTAFDGRSDYGPFIAEGVPAGGLFTGAEGVKTEEQAAIFGGTAGVPFDKCYHQACDTTGNLNADALNEMGDAAAHATLVLTRSKAGLFPDNSRIAAQSAKQRSVATTVEQKGHTPIR